MNSTLDCTPIIEDELASSATATELDTGDLETEICSLSTRLSVATARLVLLISDFDLRDGWSGYGVTSCAHWLSWRCHLGRHTAREYVRVARALRSLPQIRAEFGKGLLSYSKVRALTRVADADSEPALVELALSANAAQVERTVAAWRRCETLSEPERAARRFFTHSFDDDGMLLLRARLDSEEGAVLLAALEALQRVAPNGPSSDEKVVDSSESPSETGATALSSTDEWPPVADDDADSEKPLDEDFAIRRPAVDALVGLARAYLNKDGDIQSNPTHEMVVNVDAAVLQGLAIGGIAAYESGGSLTGEQVRRLACDTRLTVILKNGREVLDVGRSIRTVPRAIRRALLARDGGCVVPGCGEHRNRKLHAHHIIHWADGGSTCLENLVLVCHQHHRMLHSGGLIMTGTGTSPRVTSPQGRLLDRVPALPMHDLATGTTDELGAGPVAEPPRWYGDALQLHYAISTLLGERDRLRAERLAAEDAEQRDVQVAA
jgi:Domain of unknown function (DUF222)/HNH endonuclease